MTLVRVALDIPLPTLFDYRLDGATRDLVGARVLVPFGRGQRPGTVLEVGGEPQIAASRIKKVAQVWTHEPRLAADVIALMRFASCYYHHPIGQVVMGALPQVLRRARIAPSDERRLSLTQAALRADWVRLPRGAVAKRRILEHLQANGPTLATTLRSLASAAPRAVRELLAEGWIAFDQTAPAQTEAVDGCEASAGPTLTAEQQRAVDAVCASLDGFASWLLLGVTGSGKTEVYLRAIERVLSAGRQVLLLVPEINLTPQLESRLSERFPGAELVSLHSEVADAERLRRWRAAETGRARIVAGTRLAVFTPMPQLGLIIVDEEHDASLKQQDGLRYSARDLAVMRAKQRQVPIVLGSATPSLETYAKALSARYRLIELRSRAHSQLPAIRCVNTRGQRLREGLSQELIDALGQRLDSHEQSLVFVNRRGYAPALMCLACGWSAPCTRCSARLVLHLADSRLRCHYCGHEEPIALACPSCGNQDLTAAGHGTQRVERALAQLFPKARLQRIDRDTARRRQAFQEMRARVDAHELDILVGTQMLAKGHDFPRLTLVGVVNPDQALYAADFRAGERLFAQLMQVSGRAGRRGTPGQVLIQTEFPHHPVYEAVCRQDYASFARAALAERKQAGFPPFAHQSVLRAEAGTRAAADDFLQRCAKVGRELKFRVDVYDPVPAVVARVAGHERSQLLVQSASRGELQRFLDAWQPHVAELDKGRVRWSLDVDPIEL